jgi:hypothetical protein
LKRKVKLRATRRHSDSTYKDIIWNKVESVLETRSRADPKEIEAAREPEYAGKLRHKVE